MTKPSRLPAYRAEKYAKKNSVQMPVNLDAFDAMIAGLEEDVTTALRPAVQAGAEVLYQAAVRNVNAIGRKSGALASSLYQAFSERDSTAAGSGYSRATYRISWNARKAPHGALIEYGHIQRYAVHLGDDGKFYTLVRPSMRGKPRPARNASQAVKDAYYVPRAGGPKQVAAKPFLRPVFYRQGEAIAAVEARFWLEMNKK